MENLLNLDDLAETLGKRMKYVLVTGGVISGIGKGVVASSIGVLLQHSGVPVTAIKIDPYINIGMVRYQTKKNDIIWEFFPKRGGGSSQIPKLL